MNTHGGKRKGAGRWAKGTGMYGEPMERISISVPTHMLADLDAYLDEKGKSRGEWFREKIKGIRK